MEVIKSKTNQIIVLINKLKQKKYRDKLGLFFIESDKVVKEAINCNITIECLIVEESRLDFLNNSLKSFKKVVVIDKNLSGYISDCVTPQGVFAICSLNKHDFCLPNSNFIVLENLQDPDNIGAIIRSAAGAGFNSIYTINCTDPYSNKAIRTSMANVFKIKVHEIDYLQLENLSKNHTLLCADMDGEDIFKYSFDKNKRYGLIIGNEGNGISREAKLLVSKSVSIPMKNNVESLNASVSAAILMYQISSKCGTF